MGVWAPPKTTAHGAPCPRSWAGSHLDGGALALPMVLALPQPAPEPGKEGRTPTAAQQPPTAANTYVGAPNPQTPLARNTARDTHKACRALSARNHHRIWAGVVFSSAGTRTGLGVQGCEGQVARGTAPWAAGTLHPWSCSGSATDFTPASPPGAPWGLDPRSQPGRPRGARGEELTVLRGRRWLTGRPAEAPIPEHVRAGAREGQAGPATLLVQGTPLRVLWGLHGEGALVEPVGGCFRGGRRPGTGSRASQEARGQPALWAQVPASAAPPAPHPILRRPLAAGHSCHHSSGWGPACPSRGCRPQPCEAQEKVPPRAWVLAGTARLLG